MGLDLLAFKAMGPTLSPQTPVSSARVHFVNPADAIEVFVDDFTVKIPKGFYVLQAYEVAGIDILLQFGSRIISGNNFFWNLVLSLMFFFILIQLFYV
ncbi:hypothetical protein P8452_29023 [Trifolium repens]|jgi:hypothetical protein|nr:hypothetical protein P8452_29023 [Trifolium repens]